MPVSEHGHVHGWACPRCGWTGFVGIDGILRCGNAGCPNTDEYDPADGERIDYARQAIAHRADGRCSCRLAIPGVLPDRVNPACPEHGGRHAG